jgi:hypothetical protein
MSVNISCALFSLFDLLTLGDGTDRLSWYVGNNLPLYTVYYPRKVQISLDDWAMQNLVWLCVVRFRAIQLGAVRFGTSHANLRQPQICRRQMSGKNLVLHLSKYSMSDQFVFKLHATHMDEKLCIWTTINCDITAQDVFKKKTELLL